MSWNAYLASHEWNYTHNCNAMVAKVLDAYGIECGDHFLVGRTWFDVLDGMTGAESEPLLERIIGGLVEAPELFRAMNPANGWGDYDSLLVVFLEMRHAAHDHPDETWKTNG